MKRLLVGSRTLLEAALAQEGITLAQLRMLNALQENQQTSAAELSRICYITPQSMQAVVKRAEWEGWITRSASPGNRRILTATLTTTGRRVLERGLALWSGIEQEIWAEATFAELRAMNAALTGALARLQAILDEKNRREEHGGTYLSRDQVSPGRKTA